MAEVSVTKIINAPVSAVWESWDDYANIDKFHPGLSDSHLIAGSEKTGLGARRQCNLADGKNYLLEEVIGYTPQKQLVLDIYEMTFPLKSAKATINFKAVDDNRSEVTMSIVFTPKMGVIGKMMTPMMRKQFTKTIASILDTNASFVQGKAKVAA